MRELEADGFVCRAPRNEGAHVEYGLTAIGMELMPAFKALVPVEKRLATLRVDASEM